MKFRKDVLGDVFGGITTAVVMLPMALAFGVASGLGPVAGIYGAVAVGFFAAVFGGTPSQISGPTGPMTVAMAAIVTLHADSLATAFTIVMLAGVLQVALGLLRIGSFVSYTPYSVISGFMTGIGVIILTLQVMPLLGLSTVSGGPLDQIASWPHAFSILSLHDLTVGLIALSICIFWPVQLRRFVPAPLLALAVGTCIALLWFTEARTIGVVPQELPAIWMPQLTWGSVGSLIEPAILLALLGCIDSLLTSLVADSQTRTRHNPNRELVGQGIGNLAAGVLGALPGAGATMGTVTNIRAGGRRPLAGALAAIILLLMLMGFGWVVEPIPLAVLAGILMKVGWDIVDWRFVIRLHVIRREYVFVMLLTFVVTVFIDLITAVALGLIAAGIARSKEMRRSELDRVLSVPLLDISHNPTLQNIDPYYVPVGLIRLTGYYSVGSANELSRAMAADIEDHDIVILDFSETTDVDDSAALAIEELVHTALDQDTAWIVSGLSGDVAKTLNSLDILRSVPSENFVDNIHEAKRLSMRLLKENNPNGTKPKKYE